MWFIRANAAQSNGHGSAPAPANIALSALNVGGIASHSTIHAKPSPTAIASFATASVAVAVVVVAGVKQHYLTMKSGDGVKPSPFTLDQTPYVRDRSTFVLNWGQQAIIKAPRERTTDQEGLNWQFSKRRVSPNVGSQQWTRAKRSWSGLKRTCPSWTTLSFLRGKPNARLLLRRKPRNRLNAIA